MSLQHKMPLVRLLLILTLVSLGVYFCCATTPAPQSRVFGKRAHDYEESQPKRPATLAEVRLRKTMTPAQRQQFLVDTQQALGDRQQALVDRQQALVDRQMLRDARNRFY